MNGFFNGGSGGDGNPASGDGGTGGPAQSAFGPPGAVLVPDQRFGDGKVTLSFAPV
jgi:hypothetical protein